MITKHFILSNGLPKPGIIWINMVLSQVVTITKNTIKVRLILWIVEREEKE